MNSEVIKVMEESWDVLIVLDACRFDFFERLCHEYLPDGELSCRRSVGSATLEWRNRSFTKGYPDIVYVSSNPYINAQQAVMDFNGADHFFKVIDVWNTHWDKQKGTVPPDAVTHEALRAMQTYPDKRFIIHYLQPHAPYLGFGSDCVGFPTPDISKQRVLRGTAEPKRQLSRRQKLFTRLEPHVKKCTWWSNHPEWFLSQLLGLPPRTPLDAVRRKYSHKGLKQAYEENLSLTLKEVARLLQYLRGMIVVTSDHGELLGENRCYSHFEQSENPLLRNIPWWQITKSQTDPLPEIPPEPSNSANGGNEDIQQRLHDLGYL